MRAFSKGQRVAQRLAAPRYAAPAHGHRQAEAAWLFSAGNKLGGMPLWGFLCLLKVYIG